MIYLIFVSSVSSALVISAKLIQPFICHPVYLILYFFFICHSLNIITLIFFRIYDGFIIFNDYKFYYILRDSLKKISFFFFSSCLNILDYLHFLKHFSAYLLFCICGFCIALEIQTTGIISIEFYMQP